MPALPTMPALPNIPALPTMLAPLTTPALPTMAIMDYPKSEVPKLHQHAPISGEHAFPDDAYHRLRNYALVARFAIVIGSGSEKKSRIE